MSITHARNAPLAPSDSRFASIPARLLRTAARQPTLPAYHVRDAAGWQATLIGRQEIWPVHQKTADLGGMLRTGLEDTFYLPDGGRASGNGPLIEALAQCARNAGRDIASPAEARQMLGLKA